MAGTSDDELERLLRAATGEYDPVPPDVLAAAEQTYTWRRVDAELAELTFDSLPQGDQLAVVRSGSAARLIGWRHGNVAIEVQVAAEGPGLRLIGQLLVDEPDVPPASVALCRPDGQVRLDVDEWGRFESADLAAGLLRLEVPGVGSSIVTAWIAV